MSERVTMPTEDWVAALDAAREKSGVTEKLLSGELAGVILGIPAGSDPSDGLTIKTGRATAVPIDTGLAEIRYLSVYKWSVSNTGLVQGVYSVDTGYLYAVYCASYSQYIKTIAVSTITPTIDGGTFSYTPPSAECGLVSDYKWIAVGTE